MWSLNACMESKNALTHQIYCAMIKLPISKDQNTKIDIFSLVCPTHAVSVGRITLQRHIEPHGQKVQMCLQFRHSRNLSSSCKSSCRARHWPSYRLSKHKGIRNHSPVIVATSFDRIYCVSGPVSESKRPGDSAALNNAGTHRVDPAR